MYELKLSLQIFNQTTEKSTVQNPRLVMFSGNASSSNALPETATELRNLPVSRDKSKSQEHGQAKSQKKKNAPYSM